MFGPTVPLSPPASSAAMIVSGSTFLTSAFIRKYMGSTPATVQVPAGTKQGRIGHGTVRAGLRAKAAATVHTTRRACGTEAAHPGAGEAAHFSSFRSTLQ